MEITIRRQTTMNELLKQMIIHQDESKNGRRVSSKDNNVILVTKMEKILWRRKNYTKGDIYMLL